MWARCSRQKAISSPAFRICPPKNARASTEVEIDARIRETITQLERGRTAWDALASSFPAGTVSGAPKVRAMELLAGLEPKPRGFYAGAFIQHDFFGNLDSCIAIRTLELSRGQARLQAGAGIVADSRPAAEYEEIVNKLAGLRRALGAAS